MTPEQKTEFLDQSKAHFAADMLLRGTYADQNADEFKGCSVGCHLHHIMPAATAEEISDLDDKHRRVADHYGYPEWLAQLQDTIFEGLPNGESAKWHVLLAETLAETPADYDWQAALHRVHAVILRVSYKTAGTAQEVVHRVLDLHERAGRGEAVADELWNAAESAARSAARAAESAARSAAESAARSADWSAAWSAAESADWSAALSAARAAESAARSAAESAARSAAESADWSAAWSAAYQEIRDGCLKALADR
jgi:hypothetical protein